MTEQSFISSVSSFVEECVNVHRNYYVKRGYTFIKPEDLDMEISYGKVWTKVWHTERRDGVATKTSIFCFINNQDGGIYMPASTKAPAKHARGNIYFPDRMNCVGESCHIVYLRG